MVKLDGSESVALCLDCDLDEKFLQGTKKASVNYNKGVTGQSPKEQ